MFPRERVRNPNQRLIPLTPQLIQDMLEHENLEYQTPPGGHRRSSINQKIADKLKKNQIIFTKRQEKMNRKTQKRTDLESEAEIEKTRNQKNSLDVLLPARTLLSSSSDKAATLKGLIKKSSKFVTKSRIKRLGSAMNKVRKDAQGECSVLRHRQGDFSTPQVPKVQCPFDQDKRRKYTIMACIITMLCISVGLTHS
ncbi:uncharacterized protein LOC117781189 isoform X2 [Drosophila innubila]|uniref:uncharacterized protein LOC117781189 isoform X2 n=1 Tax=Drosophila innubila TaxID=198719 RepID=UPI00148E0AA6|nr:uncharacterized protein LOC117781189 isoform X2 [Drosophila innubila]